MYIILCSVICRFHKHIGTSSYGANYLSTFVPTAKSEIMVSSVSPDLCDIIVEKPAFFAKLIVSNVSLTVPIWFNLIK